jgi:hypothetical protein
MECSHQAGELFVDQCGDATVRGAHALVIGTSSYPKRTRRFSTLIEDALRRRQLPDIPGTALAAADFAKFLRDRYHDPEGKPLLTIRMLLAPTPSEDEALRQEGCTPWQEATTENVRNALYAWADDCERSGDIAVAYIGGHGINATDGASWVFLGDCNNAGSPFDAAINLHQVR